MSNVMITVSDSSLSDSIRVTINILDADEPTANELTDGAQSQQQSEGTPDGEESENTNREQDSEDTPPFQPQSVTPQSEDTPDGSGTEQQFSPEDINKDGDIDNDDLLAIASNFGESPAGDLAGHDVDGDGDIDVDDFRQVLNLINQNSKGTAPAATSHTLRETLQRIKALNIKDPELQRLIQSLEKQMAKLAPKKTALLPNYPNPFNPETWIPYHLAKTSNVQITIYDMRGTVVRQLDIGHQSAGVYQTRSRAAYWDGTNDVGERVGSSIYFYQLQADNISLLRKMVILK